MASDAAPAAVPGPNNQPPSTTPAATTEHHPSGMAGLLAPVESTRATFNLNPAQDTGTASTEQAVTGADSASVTPDSSTENGDGNNNKKDSGKRQGIIRAWMLAGADRWKKGGEARNKRLDIQKARAQAMQVKETRQVSVNRTDGLLGSGGSKSNNNSGNGKSLNRKNSPTSSGAKSPKNTSHTSRNSDGKSPSNGRTHSGPGKAHDSRGTRSPKAGRDHTASPGKDSGRRPEQHKPTRTDRGRNTGPGAELKKTPARDDKPKNPGSGSSHSAGKSGGQGPAGKPGKDAPAPDKTSPKNSSKNTPSRAQNSDTKNRPWKDPNRKTRLDKAPDSTTPANPGTKTTTSDSSKKTIPDPAAKKTPDSRDPKSKPDVNTGPGKDPTRRPDTTRTIPGPRTPRPRINLQTSREAGYRDGTRAAKTTAHARAWRDGVRDGYRDTTQAAGRETARLDQAHAHRKTARTEAPTMPQAQPATQTIPPKPDHQPGPQPVPVTSVDATHVHLGDGAARPSISRGEVRTLRNFQQRLTDKTERMTTVTEATRTLEQHAREQAKQVNELLEQARAVQGGDKVVAALTQLAEAAQVQETKAADIHRRAARSADACQAVHANAETRYGGIYQAVADSPETRTAKGHFYRDTETTSA